MALRTLANSPPTQASQSTFGLAASVALASSATIQGSERTSGLTGAATPLEPWKQEVESSIDTACGPLACRSISIRPRQGRI